MNSEAIGVLNQELIVMRELLQQRDEELTAVNRELTETNSGIVALYNELDEKTQRLEQTERMLRARNEDLKAFAHTVAHDLKAPLRGILGYANEMERKHRAGLGERVLFCLSQILVATHHLDQLIDDLLNFARLDATAPSFVEFNLPDLVTAILHDRSLAIKEQGVEVTLDIPFVTMCSWKSGLLQVLANLIDNALKFSRRSMPPRIGIRAKQIATGWRLVVTDNGVGFDLKHRERIFGLFNRLVRDEDFEGTGAGLAIVKKVLDKLGGSISVESQPGQGATFYVELPDPLHPLPLVDGNRSQP
jgi:signal transduction histidine kinase